MIGCQRLDVFAVGAEADVAVGADHEQGDFADA
jgi:hypothetical protein